MKFRWTDSLWSDVVPRSFVNLTVPSSGLGIGRHNCFGMNLAKLEMKIMPQEVLSQMDNPQFDGDIKYMKSNFVQGIKTMPITFDKVG